MIKMIMLQIMMDMQHAMYLFCISTFFTICIIRSKKKTREWIHFLVYTGIVLDIVLGLTVMDVHLTSHS